MLDVANTKHFILLFYGRWGEIYEIFHINFQRALPWKLKTNNGHITSIASAAAKWDLFIAHTK